MNPKNYEVSVTIEDKAEICYRWLVTSICGQLNGWITHHHFPGGEDVNLLIFRQRLGMARDLGVHRRFVDDPLCQAPLAGHIQSTVELLGCSHAHSTGYSWL